MLLFCSTCSQERNVVEAAARGAIESTAVIASIAVNLIAFIALMAFLDSGLHYLGAKVGYPELSFQVGPFFKHNIDFWYELFLFCY